MSAAAIDDVGAAENQTALRGADQLVGRAADGVDAARDQLANRGGALETVTREIDHAAAPLVVQHRNFFLPRDFYELVYRRRLRESNDVEIRPVHAQDRRR